MQQLRIIGRGSRLSLLQMQKVEVQVRALFPGVEPVLITRTSRGDALTDVPLQTVEGTDFFTRDIFDALATGEADIAVHSLKDMSSEHFFGSNRFAVVDRDLVNDVALFHPGIEAKLRAGETINIGTCSPRREEMATQFLQRALPQWNSSFTIVTSVIRGNVDTRLRKLDAGEYDGIILAAAGLNRLLSSKEDAAGISQLLKGKKIILLPVVECVPAPCQGAIVAEGHPANRLAMEVLAAINNVQLFEDCVLEKKTATGYGVGCLQKFGVTSIKYAGGSSLYAGGQDQYGHAFQQWFGLPELDVHGRRLFSSTAFMGSFFSYNYFEIPTAIPQRAVYVANFKAVEQEGWQSLLEEKEVWASGTRTWYELAKKGVWVHGCADALGLASLQRAWTSPLFSLQQEEVCIITHAEASANWESKGWKTISTYQLDKTFRPELAAAISKSNLYFWTSFPQFDTYKEYVEKDGQHACPAGETATLLRKNGVDPVVFPTIKAFQQWKRTYIPSPSED